MAEALWEREVRGLYRKLLERWNRRDAAGMAALFAEDGNLVGFDGSQIDGRAGIEAHLTPIFAAYPTPPFIAKVLEARRLGPETALLCAVAGMVPAGKTDIAPALNAVQTLVAARISEEWRVALFQNTPAAFHGRPEAVQALTEELRALLPVS